MPKTFEAYLPQTRALISPRLNPISANNLSSSWCNWRTARLPATKFFIRTIRPRPPLNPALRVVPRSIDNKVTLVLHSIQNTASQQNYMQNSHGIFKARLFAIKTGLIGNYSRIMTRKGQFDEMFSCRKRVNRALIALNACIFRMAATHMQQNR